MKRALLESLGNLHNIRILYIHGIVDHHAMHAGRLVRPISVLYKQIC